jgi:hypothetical protein
MLFSPSRLPALVLGLTFCLNSLPNAAAQDRYYLIVFSNQRSANDPRFAHTFATFVKASPPSAAAAPDLQVHTLSWMPASQRIAIFRLEPEPGALYDLEASLAWAESVNASISLWGPYEIEKELYDRAVQQEQRLRSGRMLFKSVDGRFRSDMALNCIHAVSDLDTDHGLLHVGSARGDAASYLVARHLERWMIHPEQTHRWLIGRLQLDRHAIIQRDW